MISLRIQTLAAAVAGAASLLAGAAHAGGHPCTSAADCGGAYRPASAAYALAPPAYAEAGYAQQGAYPPGYVGYDRASLGPAYNGGGYGAPSPCASPACAAPPPPPPAADCATYCVPAYRVVQVAPPVETVQLASDVYTGGVGVTEVYGGGGGGFTNGNFEVRGFGDASAFASSHAAAQADAVSYARSLSYAKASADAYSKAYANSAAYASTNVNIKLNASFNGKGKGGGWGHGGGGCDTCKPQPVSCDTCGGGGGVGWGGHGGGWGGKGGWGMAPSPRGGSWGGGGKHH